MNRDRAAAGSISPETENRSEADKVRAGKAVSGSGVSELGKQSVPSGPGSVRYEQGRKQEQAGSQNQGRQKMQSKRTRSGKRSESRLEAGGSRMAE